MAQTATAHVEKVSSPYYRKPYDKKAEHRRGYWLLGISAFLAVVTLFLMPTSSKSSVSKRPRASDT